MIHALGALFIFVVLPIALIVFTRYFLAQRERGWAFYALASAVLMLLFFFGGIQNAALMARFVRLATFFGWMAALEQVVANLNIFEANLVRCGLPVIPLGVLKVYKKAIKTRNPHI